MIIELTHILNNKVINNNGLLIGRINGATIDTKNQLVSAIIVKENSVLRFRKQDLFVPYEEIASADRNLVTLRPMAKTASARDFKQVNEEVGPILGVAAFTESGERLGRVADIHFELETGKINRYDIKYLWQEQLIPQQFVVAITPKRIVFADIVKRPTFDHAAA